MNIYVGNMSYDVTEDDLRQVFEAHGEVSSVKVIADHETGRSKGFAFVEMPQRNQAQAAIEKLNSTALKGRNISVNEARPKESKPNNRRGGPGQKRKRW